MCYWQAHTIVLQSREWVEHHPVITADKLWSR